MSGTGRYGAFQWGDVEEGDQDTPPPRRPGERTDTPTAEEALGTGLALNPSHAPGYDWDLRIGADGSYLSTAGIDEYTKDIAFKTARRSFDIYGQRITPDALADLELDLETLLILDARTQSVRDLTIERSRRADTLKVTANIRVDDDRLHALVFPLTR